jgi:Zn-dependent protease
MGIRSNPFYAKEIEDLVIADIVLTFSFSLFMIGGLTSLLSYPSLLIYFLPMSFIAVSLSFVLHELLHKFVAQHFGAVAAFRTSVNGLVITLASSLLGFMIGIPGATVIYSNRFTKEEEGYVSLAGPLTNFVIFAVFFAAGLLLYKNFLSSIPSIFDPSALLHLPYLENVLSMTLFISIWLAFYNMLPIYPLDGSKVLRWNKVIYAVTVIVIFALLTIIIPITSILFGLVFMLIFALLFSMLYRGILF